MAAIGLLAVRSGANLPADLVGIAGYFYFIISIYFGLRQNLSIRLAF